MPFQVPSAEKKTRIDLDKTSEELPANIMGILQYLIESHTAAIYNISCLCKLLLKMNRLIRNVIENILIRNILYLTLQVSL